MAGCVVLLKFAQPQHSRSQSGSAGADTKNTRQMTIPESGSAWKIGVEQGDKSSDGQRTARKVNQLEVVVCYEDRINPASLLLTANSGRRTLRWLEIQTPAQRHRVELFGESRSPARTKSPTSEKRSNSADCVRRTLNTYSFSFCENHCICIPSTGPARSLRTEHSSTLRGRLYCSKNRWRSNVTMVDLRVKTSPIKTPASRSCNHYGFGGAPGVPRGRNLENKSLSL
uniref:Uncharacterized protein n=1 Tax=Coccidioides posadasii RMSCC 3488 TaxID=454284 RepID=A0A0J6FI43_COCPO|nr:hypothetical protein CPAG_06300 [Coccidioides posadasii RMSCC 3488]